MTESLIDAETAARVGTVAATATGEVIRRDWQRWAAAVGDDNPLWFDPDYARANAPRRMAGGESTTFHLPAYHRDEIEMVRTISSVVEKEGRSGRFVLVTWHTVYRNQNGDLVAEATTSMIARP